MPQTAQAPRRVPRVPAAWIFFSSCTLNHEGQVGHPAAFSEIIARVVLARIPPWPASQPLGVSPHRALTLSHGASPLSSSGPRTRDKEVPFPAFLLRVEEATRSRSLPQPLPLLPSLTGPLMAGGLAPTPLTSSVSGHRVL